MVSDKNSEDSSAGQSAHDPVDEGRDGLTAVSRREALQLGAAALASAAFGLHLFGGRRAFLREVKNGDVAYVRPPGATPEEQLLKRCIRCNQCAEVCENDCIRFVSGSAADGTPYVAAREKGCILCMKCNNVCPTGALAPIADDPEEILDRVHMGTAVVDKNICNSYNGGVCGVCIRACPFPEVALKTGSWERPIVDRDKCVGCGLCENRCIVYPQAIKVIPKSKEEAEG